MVVCGLCADRDLDLVGRTIAVELATGKTRSSRFNSGVNRRVNQYSIAHYVVPSPLTGHIDQRAVKLPLEVAN
jgi:hypothetical protein